jgi:hypothetical protein
MKVSWNDLTPTEQANYGNGCGLTLRFLNVPDFMFRASCRQHDFNYARGGGLWYKVKADVNFWSAMLDDVENTKNPLFWTFVSTVYFIGVTFNPIAYIAFKYGRFRTKEEILQSDRLSKL